MNTQHILVAYASEFGSTYDIAEYIAAVFRDGGAQVDVQTIMDINHVERYTAIVIGSAIFNGAWLPEATSFVQRFEDRLASIPVALFAVSMTMRKNTPGNRRTVLSYLEPVLASAPRVQPVSIGLFAGRLHYRKLPMLTRALFWLRTRLPSGDFRNWKAIHEWATTVRPVLLGERKAVERSAEMQ